MVWSYTRSMRNELCVLLGGDQYTYDGGMAHSRPQVPNSIPAFQRTVLMFRSVNVARLRRRVISSNLGCCHVPVGGVATGAAAAEATCDSGVAGTRAVDIVKAG